MYTTDKEAIDTKLAVSALLILAPNQGPYYAVSAELAVDYVKNGMGSICGCEKPNCPRNYASQVAEYVTNPSPEKVPAGYSDLQLLVEEATQYLSDGYNIYQIATGMVNSNIDPRYIFGALVIMYWNQK